MCLEESGTDGAECRRKVMSGRRLAGTIRSLVNASDLQLECAKSAKQGERCRIGVNGGDL